MTYSSFFEGKVVQPAGHGPRHALSPTATRPCAQAFDDAMKRALMARDDFGLVNYARLAGDAAATAV